MLQVFVEQLKHPLPRILRIGRAINVGTRVIEESMRTTRIDLYLAALVESTQGVGKSFDILALDPSVIFAISVEDWTG